MTPLILFKNLSDDTRLKIMLLLTQHRELCVCDLQQALMESQPKISRHLAELRRHQLLEDERRGKWVYYRINAKLDAWVFDVLQSALHNNPSYMKSCLDRLSGSVQACEL